MAAAAGRAAGASLLLRVSGHRSSLPLIAGLAGAAAAAAACGPRPLRCEQQQARPQLLEVPAGSAAALRGVGAAEIAGNAVNEDKHCARLIGPSRSLGAAAVFDGHGGADVAARLRQGLFDELEVRLRSCSSAGAASTDSMSTALRETFAACDAQLLAGVEAGTLGVGCGACALCVLVGKSHLVVANAGDCHAVLIRGGKSVPVSSVHNADQPSERKRLKEEHPDELDIVVCKQSYKKGPEEILSSCYVKDILQPTRAFGDFYLKRLELMPRSRQGCAATPPYITSVPEVRVVPREPADQAVVMGSDGFWDEMSGRDVARALARDDMRGLTAQGIADALLAEAFKRAAAANGLQEAGLRAVPAGPLRRRMHDDITVVVVQL